MPGDVQTTASQIVIQLRVALRHYWANPDLTKSLPWLVVRPAKPGGGCDFDDRFARTVSEIVPKDGDFLLLEGEIEVFDDEDESETSEGLEAFLPLLDKPAYFLEQGSAPVLAIAWKPGPLVRNDLGVEIRERGHFSLVGKTAPTDWKPVTEDVYAFMNPVAWDIQEAQLIVGATDPVATIWAAADAIFEHDHNIEDSWETTNHCFKESVGDVVRQLLGNVVPKNFSRNDLLEFVPKEELLERVEFIREIDGLKGLRLVFASGNHRELGFY